MYLSDVETDALLKTLESKLKSVYSVAYKEMMQTWSDYINGYDEVVDGKIIHHKGLQERIDDEYEKFMAGGTDYRDINDFNNWKLTQVQRGEGYLAMADKLATNMSNTNEIAAAYINDTTPSVFSLNQNYEAYKIYQLSGADFHLINDRVVKEAILGNHVEFKVVNINKLRDYVWNRELINEALVAGIIQGKSIEKIADSFMSVMQRNRTSAIRNARTAVTSAQNAGRKEVFNQAVEMGIELQKEWVATLDDRTRDSHRDLDGQRVNNNAKFSNNLEYPGDPLGSPKEVYNCRCTMRAVLPGINDDRAKDKRIARDTQDFNDYVNNTTYKGRDNSYSYQAMKEADYENKIWNNKGNVRNGETAYDKGYTLDTLPKMRLNESLSESLLKTNPKYYNKVGEHIVGKTYSNNCQRSGVAFEMRQRKFDVIAGRRILSDGYDEYAHTLLEDGSINPNSWVCAYKNGYENIKRIEVNKDSIPLIDVSNYINQYKGNGRFSLAVSWTNFDYGHLVVAIKEGKNISYICPQTGAIYDGVELFSRVKTDSIYILKTDDLELTNEALKMVEVL